MPELMIRDVDRDDDFGAWLDELLELGGDAHQPADERYLVLSNEIGDWVGGLRWHLRGGVATLEDLAVVPEERSHGHADRLLAAFESRAGDAGAHVLEFWTDDPRAEQRLAIRGWRPVSRRADYIGHHDWTLLEKRAG